MKHENKNIPEQHEGIQTDTISSVKHESERGAIEHFLVVKARLLNISEWDKVCGRASANFKLTDAFGNPVTRKPAPGDHIRIDLPPPKTDDGEGYEWVMIEQVDDQSDSSSDEEYLAIKVHPTKSPLNSKRAVAHFFEPETSSTFLVKRSRSFIQAEVHGRNEVPNTHAGSLWGKVRNVFVALGAMLGVSKLQWKSLVRGLVKK
ncbi:MAG: hypothetical protein ACO1NU_12270 [Arcticibacter sp.]